MQKGERRLQNVELMVPIVVGTAAYYLGKKVADSATIACLACKALTAACAMIFRQQSITPTSGLCMSAQSTAKT